jgi:hypothetical protein
MTYNTGKRRRRRRRRRKTTLTSKVMSSIFRASSLDGWLFLPIWKVTFVLAKVHVYMLSEKEAQNEANPLLAA